MGNRSGARRAGATAVSSHAPTGETLTAERNLRADELPHTHTHELSYVAHKISLFMPKFVQKALDDDGGVWVSCLTSHVWALVFSLDYSYY